MDAVKFTQSWTEVQSINAAHNLAPMDRLKEFVANQSKVISPGTILKSYDGDMVPWVQGTDYLEDIVGVYAGAADLDTSKDVFGLVRVFGPLQKAKLVAWTAADGSTTAAASADALAALEALHIYPL